MSEKQAGQSFADFMEVRIKASDAFVNGSIDELLAVSVHRSPATIFPPNGACVEGADSVDAFNASGVGMFEQGSENTIEPMHMGEGDDFAYWTGFQRSVVRIKGKPDPVPMELRITELFRKEDGEWKMFHRHSDALKT